MGLHSETALIDIKLDGLKPSSLINGSEFCEEGSGYSVSGCEIPDFCNCF